MPDERPHPESAQPEADQAREPTQHDLKCWPHLFDAVASGQKTFDIRTADRDFRPGDTLNLLEWDPDTGQFSGRASKHLVTYCLSEQPYVPRGYVAMALAPPPRCAFASEDGRVCRAIEAPLDAVMGRLDSLRRHKRAVDAAAVEFSATFSGATMNAKGELTVSIKPHVDDPWKLHRDSVNRQGASVEVALNFPVPAEPWMEGQQSLPLTEQTPEVAEVIACATCHYIARQEGAEPGTVCGFCLEGELVLTSAPLLYCTNCRQLQELATAQPGDACTLCGEGRYLAGRAPVVERTADLVRFIPPARVAELSDAVSGLELQSDCLAKAIVNIGPDRFVISEIASSDPITFEAWHAVPLDEHEGSHREAPDGTDLDRLRVTLAAADGEPGAAFVLLGPAIRVLVKPEEEEAEGDGDEADDEGNEEEGRA